ncbi:sugar/nucleoside kinase (ribokinase family) [Catenulispora sp. GAS73]|uniref:substrate-binding domain-containing protein n=1 Tax=Catenulispora sp. GAS73 TaxID=3156269 RepID=UPI0035179F7C
MSLKESALGTADALHHVVAYGFPVDYQMQLIAATEKVTYRHVNDCVSAYLKLSDFRLFVKSPAARIPSQLRYSDVEELKGVRIEERRNFTESRPETGEVSGICPQRSGAHRCGPDGACVDITQPLQHRPVMTPRCKARDVTGYGDLGVATLAATPLTSVQQPVEDLGRTAVQLLMDEIEASDEHVHESRLFVPQLVRRDSMRAA